MSPEIPFLAALTIAGGGTALVATLVLYLVQARGRRAGLAPAAVSLALVGPVCGIGGASKHLTETFAQMAESGAGGAAAVVAGCTSCQGLMSLGNWVAIATLALAAVLGWFDGGPGCSAPKRPGSQGRLQVLVGLLVLPVVLVAGLHEYARGTNRIAVAVAVAPTAAPGDPGEGPGAIHVVVSRMARGVYAGMLGAPVLLLLLVGLAITAAFLAWRMEPPRWFRAVGTALLIATAALSLAGILLFERAVPIPR
jgi:hypothetical protein